MTCVNLDAESAAWLDLVRASVRRTRKRLFVLFRGGGTSLPPSEALTDLAAAVLEVAASEGRPQLCIVPCFPSIGWAVLCKGQTAEGLPAEYLNSVEVIFAAAPSTGRSGLHSDVAQQASESDQRSRADFFTGKIEKGSRGRVVYHQKVFPGRTGNESSKDRSYNTAAIKPPNRNVTDSGAAPDSSRCTDAKHASSPSKCAEDTSESFSFAVQLAEALSSIRGSSGAESPVAIGSIEPAHPKGGGPEQDVTIGSSKERSWHHVAVGGTFDRLHAGHRILLAATAIAATEAAYVGITGPSMLHHKSHSEMLQSLDDRTAAASEYLQLVRPGIKVHTAELHDAKGLAAEVPEIEALVVSSETAKGAAPINEDRMKRGYAPLQVVTVQLVGAKGGSAAKLSSTTLRAEEAMRQSKGNEATAEQAW